MMCVPKLAAWMRAYTSDQCSGFHLGKICFYSGDNLDLKRLFTSGILDWSAGLRFRHHSKGKQIVVKKLLANSWQTPGDSWTNLTCPGSLFINRFPKGPISEILKFFALFYPRSDKRLCWIRCKQTTDCVGNWKQSLQCVLCLECKVTLTLLWSIFITLLQCILSEDQSGMRSACLKTF